MGRRGIKSVCKCGFSFRGLLFEKCRSFGLKKKVKNYVDGLLAYLYETAIVHGIDLLSILLLQTLVQVANLFARDEHDEIMNDLVPIMKAEFPRRPPTQENLHDYFLYRCRLNLHVVLCFSPVSKTRRLTSLKTFVLKQPFETETESDGGVLKTPGKKAIL